MHSDPAEEAMASQESTPPDLRTLVKAAFEKARSSGKEPWNVMTVAVLKNRLLDETGRDFSEAQYGSASMSELVQQLSDILEVDNFSTPPLVKFRGELETVELAKYFGVTVRKDLWDSIVNYALGEPYVWTGFTATPQSSYQGHDDNPPVLPTLTPEEEKAWRAEFVARVSPTLDAEKAEVLRYWLDSHKSPRILPSSLQRQWNEEFKARTIERLRRWFSENSLLEPGDLLLARQRAPRQGNTQLDELRTFVIRCVQNMTEGELSELRLPPQALLRGQRDEA